jgi:hypothetical protein
MTIATPDFPYLWVGAVNMAVSKEQASTQTLSIINNLY